GDRVLRLADALGRQLGVARGDRFAVLGVNGHRYLELYHAGFLGAGIVNPLNLRLAPKELAFILNDSGTRVVFTDWLFAPLLEQAKPDLDADITVVRMGDGDFAHDVDFEELVAAGEPRVPEEPEEDDPVILMYTGGTTGLPKGVLLSQRAEMLIGRPARCRVTAGLGLARVVGGAPLPPACRPWHGRRHPPRFRAAHGRRRLRRRGRRRLRRRHR